MNNEGTALATIDANAYQPATAVQIQKQVNLIQEVLAQVMKDGTHFGVIPGTPGNKKTLFKPGSEVILTTFRIAVTPEVDDLSSHDERRYRVRAVGRTPNGVHVGTGVGECSSNEEKYKWRAAVSPKEFEAAEVDRRRVKYTRDGKTINQVRVNCEDIANTVLKMAKKRAQIDLCLTATAASDIFAQDLEEIPEGMDVGHEGQEEKTVQQPQRKSAEKSQAAESSGNKEEVIEFEPLDCEKKRNKKTGREWFQCVLPDNRICTTFDEKVGIFLKEAATNKQKVRATLETVTKDGKTYTNFVQVSVVSPA